MKHISLIVAFALALVGCIDRDEQPTTGVVSQQLANTTSSLAVDHSGSHAAIGALETATAPGGILIGTVFSGTSTSESAYSLTDSSLSMTTNRYAGYHLIDVYGTRWPITANSGTTFTLGVPESIAYPTPSTPGPGAYKIIGGAGIYVGPNVPAVTGGICTSELAAGATSCPIGYMRADHALFGTGDGNDQDLTVLGCTNIEQLRLLSPYRPSICNDCGTGSNGCTPGADCAWGTITQVNDYGAPDDFAQMVRTSNLHIRPATGADQEWTGINDGNDTGRVLMVQNDSDMSGGTPTAMKFRHESSASINTGDRFKFAGGLDDWFLEPGATMFGLHDDNVGPDRWRIAGWTSTRWPRIKAKRFDAENESNTIQSGTCGTGATVGTGGWAFTVTPGASASSCQINFISGLYSVRPSCDVSFDTWTPYNKTVNASSITVTAVSGSLGPFDVVCGGHEG